MSRQGANPNVYNYTPDDSLLVQFSGSRLRELSSQIGEELEPSIWIGEARYIAHQCMSTTVVGMGFSWDDTNQHLVLESNEKDVRTNRIFGLCRDYGLPAVSATIYPVNNYTFSIGSNNSLLWNFGSARQSANSARWTDKESVLSTPYKFYPMTKLFKGGAVAYFTIVAYKELPSSFATYADFQTWINTASNRWEGTPEDYENVKETYPNVYDIQMLFRCGAQGGQSRSVSACMFFPQEMKCVGQQLSMWDGSEFTENYSQSDPRYAGEKMSYGVVPRGARVINYYSTPYIFKGCFNSKYSATSQYSVVPNGTSWLYLLGFEGYRRWETFTTSDCDVTVSFCTYPVDQLVDLATGLGFAATNSGQSVATNGNIDTNDKIWTPTYNDQGYIDGKTNDQEEKEEYTTDGANGGFIQPNFDPYADEDDEDEEDYPDEDPSEDQKTPLIDLPVATLNSYGVFNRTYIMTKLQCQHLSDYLWNPDPDTFAEIIQDLKLVGDNVMNSIISMVMFPFEIPNDGELNTIRIGRRTTTVMARALDATNLVFEMGTCYCYAKYRNFLDYEPYTRAWLYVPFCGMFEVPLQQFMNKYIDIKLAVDLLTGSGLCIVYAAGIPILYKNCKIGMQIPVTGADSTYTIKNYIQAAESGANAVMSAASGNAVGLAGGLINEALAMLTAKNAPISSNGTSSPQCGILAPNKCYFVIERPKVTISQVEDYGKLIGYACYKSGLIGSFQGFSKFENVKLSISHCTESERNEIQSLLTSGVYL